MTKSRTRLARWLRRPPPAFEPRRGVGARDRPAIDAVTDVSSLAAGRCPLAPASWTPSFLGRYRGMGEAQDGRPELLGSVPPAAIARNLSRETSGSPRIPVGRRRPPCRRSVL